MISALAFVPPDEVVNSWDELLQILQPWINLQTTEVQQKVDDLFTYVECYYIGQRIAVVRREPRVAPVELWNVRMRTLEHYGRTENEVEGFHMIYPLYYLNIRQKVIYLLMMSKLSFMAFPLIRFTYM